MTRKKDERTKRVRKMNAILRRLYPNARIALNFSNDWELMVAIQLSAQCTDERVNLVTKNLFEKYPKLDDYVEVSKSKFEKDIHSCGFYRNKTKNILAAAKVIKEKYGGKIPSAMNELLAMPGVARKTANVVLANVHGIAEGIAVDTHVRRFAIRFDLSDYRDPVRIEKDLMDIMPKQDWRMFNHRLVHYGRDTCSARKHDCLKHPLTRTYPRAADIWPKAR